jgi:hypothetical protein
MSEALSRTATKVICVSYHSVSVDGAQRSSSSRSGDAPEQPEVN